MKELKGLKDFLGTAEGLMASYEDMYTLIDMAYEENDEGMVSEIEAELEAFEKTFEEIRIQTLLSGEYDNRGENTGYVPSSI